MFVSEKWIKLNCSTKHFSSNTKNTQWRSFCNLFSDYSSVVFPPQTHESAFTVSQEFTCILDFSSTHGNITFICKPTVRCGYSLAKRSQWRIQDFLGGGGCQLSRLTHPYLPPWIRQLEPHVVEPNFALTISVLTLFHRTLRRKRCQLWASVSRWRTDILICSRWRLRRPRPQLRHCFVPFFKILKLNKTKKLKI